MPHVQEHHFSKTPVSAACFGAVQCFFICVWKKQTKRKNHKQQRHRHSFCFCSPSWTLATIFFFPTLSQPNCVSSFQKFLRSVRWFTFTFWVSKHHLAHSWAIHDIDYASQAILTMIKWYHGHSKSPCFIGRGPQVREIEVKREKSLVYPKTPSMFLVPLFRIHRTNPQKLEYFPPNFTRAIQWMWCRNVGTRVGGVVSSFSN